ncbi:hypothetical protein PHISCL_03107 [Aspergillus sclerotialis]|uniref:Chromosome segregation ATPase family protein n=1 Tax=Aspergillus sclerotialis TaxID=2070753 RepID=A0A3A2ZNH6_9EURO|nr:hypothetical protein PHISCL_03107 [Aspergillus sclerotialis]
MSSQEFSMPSHERDASRDQELVLRRQSVPMWDSSDPERAPPPLPMNPGSSSPTTKSNISPNIQAVAANFAEKARDNAPSPYTMNPMPQKPSSPEKSLIKGHYHKRMQSLQNTDTRSEFLNYLEKKSPERPQRASMVELGSKQQDKSSTKSGDSTSNKHDTDKDRDIPNYFISNRYLSRPILGESTPPSATMLALQNMQLPGETESSPPNNPNQTSSPEPPKSHNFDSLASQIHSLTDIASNLQREMAQLSRRSKDNATDLVSLKAATNSRDEDIRKSLRDLSSSLSSRFLDHDGATRWDASSFLSSGDSINHRDPDSSPSSKKSFSMPRATSPSPFAAAMERELCGSPAPISDGSASIALLEKVLREMATKDGQEKLLELVEEAKSRSAAGTSNQNGDSAIKKMLEEILDLVKEDFGSKALVPSKTGPNDRGVSPNESANATNTRSRSLDLENANIIPGMSATRSNPVTEEILSILKRVKSSVMEGGGMTNEVKALVRELRGEVLGMGRNIAQRFEEVEAALSVPDDKPIPPGKEDISAIVHGALRDLREQMASIVAENRHHSSALSEFRATMSSAEIYSLVKKAFDEFDPPQPQLPEPREPGLQRDEILETVREAWETYKPEIELQNFGLEREEILECLAEGLKEYRPQHEQAVTYDQVLAAVQAGMQNFEQPQSITKDEITQTIRECLESHQSNVARSAHHEHLESIRDEILQAVTQGVTSQSTLTRDTLDSGLGRDEILSAVSDGVEAHFMAAKGMEQSGITKEDVTSAINDAFAAQNSAISTNTQPPVSREEILSAIAEGLDSQSMMGREIELNRDDLMDAISSGLHEAASSANLNVGEQVLERLHDLLEGMKEEFKQYSTANGKDTEQVLDAVRDGLDVVRKEIESYAVTASDASGKHEIMDTVKEGFRLLQADMEKTITENALSNAPRGNPDTPELLDAMEREFEHLRQTLSSVLIRDNASSEKDEILDAIHDIAESQKGATNISDLKAIKEELEHLRQTMGTSLVRSEPSSDKDDIIAALRESMDTLRDEGGHQKGNDESTIFATAELLDAFKEGVGTIRNDLEKLSDKPAEFDSTPILESIKDGISGLKADIEMLRQSPKDSDGPGATRGGELMLADESNNENDADSLKTLIGELHTKIESLESSSRAAEPSHEALKREHLDEILFGLHEIQGSIAGESTRSAPVDDTTVKKEHTDAIESLLRSTKSQLDELVFPPADELARAEHLAALEGVVKETKDAIFDLSTRFEAEGPTKSEIGTLETLLKDMWIALDELKGKGSPSEEESEKLVKSDLQTVEAMIFEVKTQVDELKLPDVETLPTKNDIQELSALVTDFREKVEAENEMTGQAFEARKVEHGGLAEKIEEAKAIVGDVGDELKSKLDGSNEGLIELKQLLEGLTASAESFTTVENVKELTELINREFERSRGELDASKLEKEEHNAAAMVKHDETRAAIVVELGAKIDEKLNEVMKKYDDAQTTMSSKFSETEERDNSHLEAITNTKAIAEDIKLVIGSMGTSVNETCERISVDTKTFFEKVSESYNKMEEMHNEVKSHQEHARTDLERTAATTNRMESKLHEFHPQILETVKEILSIVGQHYDHSQSSAREFQAGLSALPSSIPSLLPALPSPEQDKYDDSHVREKLDDLLGHAKNNQIQEGLNTLLERVTNDQVHDKLDQLLSHSTSTNSQVYEKLDELLNHATGTNGPVHEKLDTLLDRAGNTDQSVTQMMKLDEMHKDIMETSRRMNEMMAAQTSRIAEDNERRRQEAEEAAVMIERRNAQRAQVESEIAALNEEKDALLNMIQNLKTEKEDIIKQNTKLSKELSGLEMALDLRHEEMQVMEERADSLEKRILEGVLDHARTALLSRPNGQQAMNLKRTRTSGARKVSNASTASTVKDSRSILGSGVGMALKRRAAAGPQPNSTTPSNMGSERRILSLSHVTSNRGAGPRQVSANSGLTGLKRSHSVKTNFSQRKASWGGRSSVANKENEAFPEEEELPSGDESDAATERRTSYTGSYADSMVYGTASAVSADRKTSLGSFTNSQFTDSHSAVEESVVHHDQEEDDGQSRDEEYASASEDDAQTTKADDEPTEHQEESAADDANNKELVIYGQHSDSGLGTEITSGA